MEKYSRFSDPTTGVNPWVPTWSTLQGRPWALSALELTLCALIFLPLRVAVLAVALVFLVVTEWLLWLLTCLPRLQHTVGLLLQRVPLHLALISLGVNCMHRERADGRRLRLSRSQEQQFKQKDYGPPPPDRQDLILFSNYTSIVEVIYLRWVYRPVFVQVTESEGLQISSFGDVLYKTLTHQPLRVKPSSTEKNFPSLVELHAYCKQHRIGPIVIFPEITKTNGTAIFEWDAKSFSPPEPSASEARHAFYQLLYCHSVVVAFQYAKSSSFSPPHTVYGPFAYLFRLASYPHHSVTITTAENYQVRATLSNTMGPDERSPVPAKVLQALRQIHLRLLPGAQSVQISIHQLDAFSNYFSSTQQKKYHKA